MGRHSKYPDEFRRHAVLGVLTKRMTVQETCRELGVSEQTQAR